MWKECRLKLFYILLFVVGGISSYLLLLPKTSESKRQVSQPCFVYKGNLSEKLDFKTYEKGLYESDSTVLQYYVEGEWGIMSTPEVVGQVATIILGETFVPKLVKANYPYYITKEIATWDVAGVGIPWPANEKESLDIRINRSNGMVVSITIGYMLKLSNRFIEKSNDNVSNYGYTRKD